MALNTKYLLPIVPVLETRTEWRVAMSENEDAVFSFELVPEDGRRGYRTLPGDPLRPAVAELSEVRKRFFAIRTPQEALEFLTAYGPFVVRPLQKNGSKRGAVAAYTIKWSQLQDARVFFEEALLASHFTVEKMNMPNMQYLLQELELHLDFFKPEQLISWCYDVSDAIRASVFLDKVEASPWRRCARADCRNLFKITTKHPKKYCEPKCATLCRVRERHEKVRALNDGKLPRAKSKKSRKKKGAI